MNPSPYRSADDRFPYLAHLKVAGLEFDFLMVSERSENWYGKGEGHGEYLGLIEPGDLVVDAGANEGYTAILAALTAGPRGTVRCIEAAPHNWAPLVINARLNDLTTIMCQQGALGEKMGRLAFAGEAVMSEAQPIEPQWVPMMALDDMCLRSLDVLKLDIEGYEMKALRGARQTIARFRPDILLELHLDGLTDLRHYGDQPEDLWEFAREHHYQILRDGRPALELASGVVVLKPLC